MRLFPAIAAAAILTAATAQAQMMTPDTSPDSGLKGVWRVITAKPAPWAKPHTLQKSETPLLEYAIDFSEGAVKGPAPLGCAAARYSSGNTDPFGGKLKTDAMRQAVFLKNGGTTYRIVCNGANRDFYVDDNA